MRTFNHILRIGFRVLRLLIALALSAIAYFFAITITGRSGSVLARSVWMQGTARRLMSALAIEPTYIGEPPTRGVLVSNHLSYLDILVFGARHPLVFISKSEVAGWPIFGQLAKWAGTLFIRRDLRSDVVRIGEEMPRILDAGVVLAFFPEGTSTGGDRVLPFRASLMAPLAEKGWVATPAFLRYELEPGDGSVEDEVAYWRDMVFGPHLLNLMGKRGVRAVVTYGQPEPACPDRKALAGQLREKVCRLGGLSPE
ncbi:MAG: lysophospholipid acyltransferase family protein [Verrucomicrobiota bacterium]